MNRAKTYRHVLALAASLGAGALALLGVMAACQGTGRSPQTPDTSSFQVIERKLNKPLRQLDPEIQKRVLERLVVLDERLIQTPEPGERVKLRLEAVKELRVLIQAEGLEALMGLRSQVQGDPLAQNDVRLAFHAAVDSGARYRPTAGDLALERSHEKRQGDQQ